MDKHGVTETEMEGLSEAEKAALADDGEDATATADAETDTDKDDKVAADAAAAAAKDKPAEAAAEPPAEREPLAVPFQHESKVDAAASQASLDALQKRFDDGEIELAAYNAERDKIRDAAIVDRVQTEISAKSQEQMAAALWQRAVDEFHDAHPAYKKDDVLYDALNERVKRMAADPVNANISDKQLLSRAHEDVAKRFVTAADSPKPADQKQALLDKRKPDLSTAPKTIGALPAAADNIAAEDEFAALDRLAGTDTAAYERALAKLPEDQQDRYLRATA